MIFKLAIALLVLGFHHPFVLGERRSIEPFLSGDTFRAHADHIFDDTNECINFTKVGFGSTFFVKTDFLPKFFQKIHPYLVHPYVLITHNSDLSIPGEYEFMLNDQKILAWFGQNVENCIHPKLHPIPIGLANYYWPNGNIELLIEVRNEFKSFPKKHILYMNFDRKTNVIGRSDVYFQFIPEHYCFRAKQRNVRDYFADVASSVFVLSPRGNGVDCHRTWEALYLGAIPIVDSSSLDPIFDTLPVVITHHWKEIALPFLEEKKEEFEKRLFSNEKLWTDYWFKRIDAYKSKRLSANFDFAAGL